jgi:hypothetical protein
VIKSFISLKKLKTINFGMGLSAFTWWFAAIYPQFPPARYFILFLFFPWIIWDIKYSHLIRTIIWPLIILALLLLNHSKQGFPFLSQIFLTLGYFFFVLEQPYIQTTDNITNKHTNKLKNFYPEMFMLLGISQIILISLWFEKFQSLYLMLFTFFLGGQIYWWKVIQKPENKNLKHYLILYGSVVLILLTFSGFFFGNNILLFGTITSLSLLTMLTPFVKPE